MCQIGLSYQYVTVWRWRQSVTGTVGKPIKTKQWKFWQWKSNQTNCYPSALDYITHKTWITISSFLGLFSRLCYSPCMAAAGSASHGCSAGSSAWCGHKRLLHFSTWAGAARTRSLAAGPTRGGRIFMRLIHWLVCSHGSASLYLFSCRLLEHKRRRGGQRPIGHIAGGNMQG